MPHVRVGHTELKESAICSIVPGFISIPKIACSPGNFIAFTETEITLFFIAQ